MTATTTDTAPDHLSGHVTTRIGHNQKDLVEGATGPWEVIIGLEVHAQVTSEAKLFSGASTAFGAAPNSQVSLVDAGMPGMLPVINGECVRQAVRTGLGLGAQINLRSVFDRKNFFYPDMPQGYQISQFTQPIVGEGRITVDLPDGESFEVGIERLHLEQDAGKSIHDQHPQKTYIDLNRSGVALMEIVSRPDLRSAEEAAAYLSKLRSILRYLGTCDGDMSQGSMRADVNVSVRRPGEELGTRCEIKNVNSLRFVRQAIDYEARRQIDILEDGGEIDQETRLFDANRGETRSMRSKEEAHDYRYFPDPDLLPVVLEQSLVDALKVGLPELPDAKKARFIDAYELSAYDAGVLVAERETAEYFEAVVDPEGAKRDPKLAANWVTAELFGRLNAADLDIAGSPVAAAQLGGLIDLIADNTISGRIAKDVFAAMFDSGKDAGDIVAEKGLKQITDSGAIEALIDQLIADNPQQAEQYRGGNTKVAGWFTGQAMKATQGQANPQMVNQILKDKLGG
ncbi:MAG: Asp-tRNA(Asn)/Glu-tRNA(Gln) amidotransferase subunit GatB [Alphaproteobacteria bacterium]|nr:Asp-tRNA(Asn)/Glu-tRNA(Gln) amidotransferase subunit GatB [Alphaproteobacteria bacterium]MCZ6841095.1 Asp-tRNA(Asn)/Glu-tRNA(Gln) amidotransferase subunit GatB [Alphaproteobacteria bacterium]